MPKILEMVPVLAFSQKVMIIFNLSLEREKKKKNLSCGFQKANVTLNSKNRCNIQKKTK